MSRASIGFKIAWRLIKLIFSLCVFTVIAILLWRIFSSGDPKSMKPLHPTAELSELYKREGDELYMFTQKQRSMTSGENNYGYFFVTRYRIIPEINQIEILVRYNTATIRNVAADMGLESVPSRDEDLFDVSLTLALDKTPEDKSDNSGNNPDSVEFIRCRGEVVSKEQKNLYNYIKLVFDTDSIGIDLEDNIDSELLLAVYTDFYFDFEEHKPNYGENPLGAVCLYDYSSENIREKLSSADKKALEAFEK